MPRVSGITLIFLVVFLTKQSSPSPMTGWKELEEALSAEKVLLPEAERNKTKDEGPDYFYDKNEEEVDKNSMDYNLENSAVPNVPKVCTRFNLYFRTGVRQEGISTFKSSSRICK